MNNSGNPRLPGVMTRAASSTQSDLAPRQDGRGTPRIIDPLPAVGLESQPGQGAPTPKMENTGASYATQTLEIESNLGLKTKIEELICRNNLRSEKQPTGCRAKKSVMAAGHDRTDAEICLLREDVNYILEDIQILYAITGSVTVSTSDILARIVRRLESVEEQPQFGSYQAHLQERDESEVPGNVLQEEELKIQHAIVASNGEDLENRAAARKVTMILVGTLALRPLTIATSTSRTRQMTMKAQVRMPTSAAGKSRKARCRVARLGRSAQTEGALTH